MLYIIDILSIFEENIPHYAFPEICSTTQVQRMMEQVGENIKLARKRRKLTTIQGAERAGIDRTRLTR
jgi:hypothetical protein